MASLTLLRGEEEGETYPLDAPEISIGREEGCTLRLEGLGLSRRHCSILRDGERYLLRDLDSENGTWVNGQRVREQELRDGDLVGLGVQASLRFRNPAQASEPDPAAAPGADAPAPAPSVDATGEEPLDDPRMSRWLLVLALLGLAFLIGLMVELCLRA